MNEIPSVRSVMTAFPYSVEVDDSVLRARSMMVEHEIRHLPVKERGVLVGIITDRDLKRAMDPDLGLSPKDELFVSEVFIPGAYVVDRTAPLDTVLEHMASRHIGSALVTKNDRLVGIFTAADACRLLAEKLRSLAPAAADDGAA